MTEESTQETLSTERILEVMKQFEVPKPTEAEWHTMTDSEKFQSVLQQPGAYIAVSPDVWEGLEKLGKADELTRLSGREVIVVPAAPKGSLWAVAPPPYGLKPPW
jgi:hypothetical protein